MTETEQQIPVYEYLGVLTDTPELTVQAARQKGGREIVLVNRITHSPNTNQLFRELYFYSQKNAEHGEFLTLFNVNQDFYAVFRHHQAPALADLYWNCTGSVDRRLAVLTAALFQVALITQGMPDAVVCSVLQPENILEDSEGNIRLLFRLFPDFMRQDEPPQVWGEITKLVEFMLEKELKGHYYQSLRIVARKCRAGLYGSLAELVKELQKASASLSESGFIPAIRRLIQQKKQQIAQISWLGLVTVTVFLIIFLITEFTRQPALPGGELYNIGTVTYVAAQDGETNRMRLTDPAPGLKQGADPMFFSLPDERAPLVSEDYIFRSGDTLEAVCTAWYGSAAYAQPVVSFNGLTPGVEPEAGSVLRLPLKDQLAAYLAD